MAEIRAPWAVVLLVGVTLAALTGGLAAWAQGGDDSLRFVVFGVMSLPCWLGLTSLLRTRDERPEHHEQSVEMQWAAQATSGAFLDLLVVLGLATAASAVLDTEPVPTVAFLVVGLVDCAARYVLQQRREG